MQHLASDNFGRRGIREHWGGVTLFSSCAVLIYARKIILVFPEGRTENIFVVLIRELVTTKQ